ESKKTPHVLLIEDNETSRRMSQVILMQLNCLVDTADSEPQVCTMFKPGQYDLVLMDIKLNDTSGYAIAKYIRTKEQKAGEHVSIIALTGYPAENLMLDCIRYHIDGAITKPLGLEQAQQLIQRYVFNHDVPVVRLKIPSSQN
ncbi:MAG: response regulator, partial [Ignavibacteria bacterium]|nr:response regulator [Ignavibacteria bacterium]